MSGHDLEAPGTPEAPNWASLYRARGDEVSNSRPIFTGDVFEDTPCIDESGNRTQRTVLVLQHPCALRVDGVNLVPRLLVAEVRDSPLLPIGQWKGSYKFMPLPELRQITGDHFRAYLHEPHLIEAAALQIPNRIACMSQTGVNLLLQRWVHHNSRVIVPTSEYLNVTVEQFEEADLIEDWCDELASTPEDVRVETASAHDWLRSPSHNPEAKWQDLLKDPQTRGTVRSAMRKEIRALREARR